MDITAAIAAIAPHETSADQAAWVAALGPELAASGFSTPERAASFLGQVAEESEYFRVLGEDLNYSAAELIKEWPSRFNSANAGAFARVPEKIANSVYASRMGNGPYAGDDGWAFRGRGLIQLTGKDQYVRFGQTVGLSAVDTAAYLTTKVGAAKSACWYWSVHSLMPLADRLDTRGITLAINGGLTNFATRDALVKAALKALS